MKCSEYRGETLRGDVNSDSVMLGQRFYAVANNDFRLNYSFVAVCIRQRFMFNNTLSEAGGER